jgi:hypothetical protein
VLHTKQGLLFVGKFRQLGDIGQPEEVAIAEKGPAFETSESRREKTRIGVNRDSWRNFTGRALDRFGILGWYSARRQARRFRIDSAAATAGYIASGKQ